MAGDVATATLEVPLVTGDELFAFTDLGPCELIDGRIVSPSDAWQAVHQPSGSKLTRPHGQP